jgi:hypothetical protein
MVNSRLPHCTSFQFWTPQEEEKLLKMVVPRARVAGMDNQAAGPDVSVSVVCEECVRAVTLTPP